MTWLKNAQKELRKFVSDYNLDGLTEEFNSTFGDITDLSTKKVKEMLEAFREQILSSTFPMMRKKRLSHLLMIFMTSLTRARRRRLKI
jgi:hypothetical protein